MEQNTDRMWWTIGAVLLGGILIAGAILLLNTTLLPNIKTKVNDLDRTTITKPNLLNGTSVNDIFKGTGTTNAGGTQKYTLDNGLKISDLKLNKYQDLVFEFDWKATGTNPSGAFVYQTQTFYKGTWITISPTNTSGHVKNTFYNLPVATDPSTFMNIRQDNIPTNVTVEISNVMMYTVD